MPLFLIVVDCEMGQSGIGEEAFLFSFISPREILEVQMSFKCSASLFQTGFLGSVVLLLMSLMLI